MLKITFYTKHHRIIIGKYVSYVRFIAFYDKSGMKLERRYKPALINTNGVLEWSFYNSRGYCYCYSNRDYECKHPDPNKFSFHPDVVFKEEE